MNWYDLEGTFAYWFAVVIRLVWCYIAIRSTSLAWHEYKLNKDAYNGGRYLRNGKRIIRRGRFLRSRWFLISFSIAALIGVFASIGFFIYPPEANTTNWISIVSSMLIVTMLYGFEQAKETDVDMRAEAREFKRATRDPNVEQRVGEEIVHPPVDIKDNVEDHIDNDDDDVDEGAGIEGVGDEPDDVGGDIDAFGDDDKKEGSSE